MMRDISARFKYSERDSDAPTTTTKRMAPSPSPSNQQDSATTDTTDTTDTTETATAATATDTTDACPSRELIQRCLRSYYRDMETRTATWRDVSKRMQRDLAPYSTLKLGGFALGNIAPKLLGHVLIDCQTHLRTLDLGFNRISDRGAALLAHALGQNRSLSQLYLSGNDIGPTGAGALATALVSNTTLTSLHLSGNNIGEDGAARLADGLRANAGLRALYVGTNGIGSNGMAALADALTVNRTLEALTLGQNCIGSDGLQHLAAAIRTGSTVLTTLEIGKNNVDAAGALALAKAMCAAPNALSNLYVDNNPLGDAGASAFGALLAKNTVLRVLDVSYSHMSLVGLRDLSVGLAYSRTLLCLLVDGHDWASTQYMRQAATAPAPALSAKGASSYAASCIVSAIAANPHSVLVKLTGVDLSQVAPPAAVAGSPDGSRSSDVMAQAAVASSDDTAGSTRRYSDTLTRNERVLKYLQQHRRVTSSTSDSNSNKRKIADDSSNSSDVPAAAAAVTATRDAVETTTLPKYQRLDAHGPVKSSSSSGSIGSSNDTATTLAIVPTAPPIVPMDPAIVSADPAIVPTVTTAPLSAPPTYTAHRPPRVGLPSRGSLAQLPTGTTDSAAQRLALKSPRYETTMDKHVRKVVADIAALPFNADEYANLQAFYLGGCHGPKDPATATAAATTAADEPSLCPACCSSRLAKFRRVMAVKARLEARKADDAAAPALLTLLRQLHYLIGVFQHVDNADERIDALLAAVYEPVRYGAPPRPPTPATVACTTQPER